MNYSKELLLSVATILVSTGVTMINTKLWTGIACLILGVLVFVGRGFYKKYLECKPASPSLPNSSEKPSEPIQ